MARFSDIEEVPNGEHVECTACGERLTRAVWLELDMRTNHYTDTSNVPPEHSQGWHPFGTTCAKKVVSN